MDWIMQKFQSLQIQIAEYGETSSSSANRALQVPGQRLNDSVFEVCNPEPPRLPSVEIVFFHGLNLHGSKDAHFTTWFSTADSVPELWLVWILKEIPQARILLISYNAFAERKDGQQPTDMYCTCENLVQDLTDSEARVGQGDCPVVLVGHSVGCLVMKELCSRLDSTPNPHERERNLLLNVKGLFYYACPHHGSKMADESVGFAKAPFFEELTTLNSVAQRRNETFRKVRGKYSWSTYGIGEGLQTAVKGFKGCIVPEGSARSDVDEFYTDYGCDHFSICRPKSRKSTAFRKLSQFITDILDKDERERVPNIDIPNGLVGLEKPVEALMGKLDEFERLAIIGMGGIGKTIMAKVLYESLGRSFEYACFLPDVKNFMTSKENDNELRKKIIEGLSHRRHRVDESFRWKMLKGKKVLIVLDDVEFRSQVRVMLGSDGFARRSRIVVTSRDSQFLDAEGFHCYHVQLLGTTESTQLISLNAFKTDSVLNEYRELADRFVEKCGGLPLALSVVGNYLHAERNVEVWEDALKRLKEAKSLSGRQEDELWSVLRVSYDSLAKQEQQLFLDVATCFFGEDLEKVKRAWRVCGWAPFLDSGLKNLVDKSLITIEKIHGTDSYIQMHEVLRDLGRSIACPDPENVSEHSRVWFDKSNYPLPSPWPFDEGKATVKVLKITGEVEINMQTLNGLKELRILWVAGDAKLDGPFNLLPPKLLYMAFHGSIWDFQREWKDSRCSYNCACSVSRLTEPAAQPVGQRPTLRHLALRHLELTGQVSVCVLDTLGDFQALQSLVIAYDHWEGSLPQTLSQLQGLKCLVIQDCCHQGTWDALGDLQSLEHLEISGTFPDGIPKAFGKLRALKYLEMRGPTPACTIPETLGDLKKLEFLRLPQGCWKTLPKTLRNLQALRHLEMWGCQDWEALRDTVGHLKALRKFVLHCSKYYSANIIEQLKFLECLQMRRMLQATGQVYLPVMQDTSIRIEQWNLKALPEFRGNFVALRQLTISSCHNLEDLPDSLGEISSLQLLLIDRCKTLTGLPDTFQNLRALKSLEISRCPNLQALPVSVGELLSLQRLHIEDCNALTGLPNTLRSLQALEYLSILHCQNLQALPATLGKLLNLQRLHVEGCNALTCLPDTFQNLQALKELTISQCENLQALPVSLGELLSLQRLHIEGCNAMTGLPDTFQNLQALKELTISQCENLQALPVSLGELLSLQRLHIEGCNAMTGLPDTFANLQDLSYLSISNCQNLEVLRLPRGCWESIPKTLRNLQALRHLEMSGCQDWEALEDIVGHFSALQKFVVHNSPYDTTFEQLKFLECLQMRRMLQATGQVYLPVMRDTSVCVTHWNLKALPEFLGMFKAMQQLRISYCDNLQALPDSLGELSSLRLLHIEGCNALTGLPDTFGNLQDLKDLTIWHCKNLQALPVSLGELRSLQRLHIEGCNAMTGLPDTFGNLQALRHLEMSGCQDWEALEDIVGHFSALQKFVVHNSPYGTTFEQLKFLECLQMRRMLQATGQVYLPVMRDTSVCITHWNLKALPEFLGMFKAMQQLRISYCDNLQALPDSLGELSSLRLLHIEGCNALTGLPDTFGNLQDLKELTIWHCKNLQALPVSLGELRSLQRLHIEGCNAMTGLPDTFGNLQALRHLEMSGCQDWEALEDIVGHFSALQKFVVHNSPYGTTFEQLKFLECLQMRRMLQATGQVYLPVMRDTSVCITHWNLKALPEFLGMFKAMQQLRISYCDNLQALPDSLGELSSLRLLHIEGCNALTGLPDTFGNLQDLKELTIWHCKNLQALPVSLGELRSLQRLHIEGCNAMTGLPDTFGNLQALRHLEMSGCQDWEALEDIVGHFSALQKFVVHNSPYGTTFEQLKFLECLQMRRMLQATGQVYLPVMRDTSVCITHWNLKALPEFLGMFKAMQQLRISYCDNLQALPDSLGELSSLRLLHIEGCNALTGLPDTFGNLQDLKELTIWHCKNLQALPVSLGELRSLQRLHIEGCNALTGLPDTFGNLQDLKKLKISQCKNLQALPVSLGELLNLQRLHIKYCNALTGLPDTFGNLQDLEELKISRCMNLQALPVSLGELLSLERLHIKYCNALTGLPDTFGNLQDLKKLKISQCENLQALPVSLGELLSLQRLHIKYCNALTGLPDTFGNLQDLKELKISWCMNLQALPVSLGELLSLQRLHIKYCNALTGLPDTFGNLQDLKELTISQCENLQALPVSLGELLSLQLLHIEDCNALTGLPDTFGNLQDLKMLTILQCENLQALPVSHGELLSLQWLHIKDCNALTGLPDTFQNLQSPERAYYM